MSELGNIVESVQAISANLNQTRQAALAWQRQLAQDISYIIDQVDGTSQTDIKECLVAVRSAIGSIQKMQEALGQSIVVANAWIEKNSGGSSSPPMSNHVMSFSSGYEPEEEPTHGHRR